MESAADDPAGPLCDIGAMRLALEQARAAAAAGEVPVGAVVVRGGRVLATGANAPIRLSDPTAHAEIVALRAAAAALGNYRLDDCTLYVTLEPCAMCAGAMLHARLDRVVFGAADPRTGAAGSVVDLFARPLLNHRTRVESGLLAAECGAVLLDFFNARRAARARSAEPVREDALRTPASAFSGLGGLRWEGAYRRDLPSLGGLRMHHAARGPAGGGPVFVCLHRPDDWGVRFAEVAEMLAGEGALVLVPDLVGFGRSDKPKREAFHSLERHVEILAQWCRACIQGPVVLLADRADAGLAAALCDRLRSPDDAATEDGYSSGVRGVVLLAPHESTGAQRSRALLPFPDRGHAAGPRAFAGGWGGRPAFAPETRVLHLAGEGAEQLAHAVEYFRA